MAVTPMYVFDEDDQIHVIGIERQDHALSLMIEHAEEHNLTVPNQDYENYLSVTYCNNVRVQGEKVLYDVVNRLLVSDAQKMHTYP